MSSRNTFITVSILIILSTLAGFYFWGQLPEMMASHWDINDQVNGYMPRLAGVLTMPVISLVMLALFLVIPGIDPLKANIASFREYFNIFIVLMVIFLAYIHALSLAWNLGYTNFKMSQAMLPGVGLLFIFIGQLLGKAKRNFFIGIRTPWTLSSDAVWNETHRVGGRLFSASGAATLLGFFFPGYAEWFLIIPLIGTAAFTVIYSYILFQREKQAK